MCFHNIQQEWFSPKLFVRSVNPTDFKEYKMSPATMMDGFHGEYFGMSDKDSEQTSYTHIAMIQKMLGINENSEIKMHIAGQDEQ